MGMTDTIMITLIHETGTGTGAVEDPGTKTTGAGTGIVAIGIATNTAWI